MAGSPSSQGTTYKFWRIPDRGITGGYLLVAGLGMGIYSLGRIGSFGPADPALLFLALAAFAVSAGFSWLKTPEGEWHGSGASMLQALTGWIHPSAAAVPVESTESTEKAEMSAGMETSAALERISSLIRKQGKDDSPWATLLPESVTTDASGKLVEYAIQADESGYFANETNTKRVRSLLSQAVSGKWRIRFNPIKDIAHAELATEFPAAVPPPPKTPAQTMDEVNKRYPSSRWTLGVDAMGRPIGPKPTSIPHALVIAGTGGGKSVWARELIESKSSDGWMIFLGDGKGTDFTALAHRPNIVMVSNEPAQHVVLVRAVRKEMDRRYALADQAKRNGQGATAFDFPPLLLLLDEFASMRQEVVELAGKEGDSAFAGDISLILRKGREARVHMAISSQELRAQSIDGSWQENLKLVVSLGRPTEQTLKRNAFPSEFKGEVKLIGDRITAQGRGVYVDVEEGEVVEFQSYYGWSPGTTTLQPGTKNSPPTPETAEAWEKAARVCETYHKFYPRLGIQVNGPEWRDSDRGLDAIAATPTVVLDSREGPIADRFVYDPWSDDWKGKVPLNTAVAAVEFAEQGDPIPEEPPLDQGDPGRSKIMSIQAESLEEPDDD